MGFSSGKSSKSAPTAKSNSRDPSDIVVEEPTHNLVDRSNSSPVDSQASSGSRGSSKRNEKSADDYIQLNRANQAYDQAIEQFRK